MSPRACYRYKTPVLTGPWRRRPEKALDDALRARQARCDEQGEVAWEVSGTIESNPNGVDAAVANSGTIQADGGQVLLTAQAVDAKAGRALARQCQTCHGIDGIARIPIAPHLAGESEIYLQTQLKAFRSGKREHEMMTVVAKKLSDEQIADLAAWYASIEISVKVPD